MDAVSLLNTQLSVLVCYQLLVDGGKSLSSIPKALRQF